MLVFWGLRSTGARGSSALQALFETRPAESPRQLNFPTRHTLQKKCFSLPNCGTWASLRGSAASAASQMSVSVRVGPCWSAWLFRCVSDTSRTPRRCVPPEADRLLPKQPQSRAAVAMARQRPTKHEAQRTTHKAQRIFAPSTWHLPPRRLAAAIFLPPEWTFSRTW